MVCRRNKPSFPAKIGRFLTDRFGGGAIDSSRGYCNFFSSESRRVSLVDNPQCRIRLWRLKREAVR